MGSPLGEAKLDSGLRRSDGLGGQGLASHIGEAKRDSGFRRNDGLGVGLARAFSRGAGEGEGAVAAVMPAEAGIPLREANRGSGFRRNDGFLGVVLAEKKE